MSIHIVAWDVDIVSMADSFPFLQALLAPLEAAGIVVPRTKQKLLEDRQYFGVIERDRLIIACAALIPYHGTLIFNVVLAGHQSS